MVYLYKEGPYPTVLKASVYVTGYKNKLGKKMRTTGDKKYFAFIRPLSLLNTNKSFSVPDGSALTAISWWSGEAPHVRDSAAGDKTVDGEQSPHRDGFFSVPVVVIGRRRTRKSETLTLQKFVHKKEFFR